MKLNRLKLTAGSHFLGGENRLQGSCLEDRCNGKTMTLISTVTYTDPIDKKVMGRLTC